MSYNMTAHADVDWIALSAGSIYIFFGIIGVFFNTLNAIAIIVDRGLLTNPFYYFILHLSIADTLCVAASGCYTGLAFCQMAFSNVAPSTWCSGYVRFFGFLINATYYASGWMLALITSTRLISCGYPHLKQKVFSSTTLNVTMSVIWFVYTAMALPCLFYDSIVYIIDRKSLTWYYNREATWPKFFNDYDMVHNIVTMILILILNLWIVGKLQSKISQTNSLQNSQSRRLEIKLFVQCAISGGFYAGEGILFAVFTRFQHLPTWLTFVSHLLWLLNHVNNSLVFLIMNAKLRNTIIVLLRIRKLNAQVTPFLVIGRRNEQVVE